MPRASAVEFQRSLGEYLDAALREPLEITRYGRPSWVLVSASQYQWLVAASQRVYRTSDASAVVVDAVEKGLDSGGPTADTLD